MRRLLFGACCAVAACGPATAPPSGGPVGDRPTQIVTTGDAIHVATSAEVRVISQEVAAPVERVWAVLPAVYAELGLEGGADATRRTVAASVNFNRRFQGQPATRLVNCGQGQFGTQIAASYTIRMAVSTTVNPGAGTGSRLDTRLEATARGTEGANAVAAQCRTEGALEELIATRVREKLAG